MIVAILSFIYRQMRIYKWFVWQVLQILIPPDLESLRAKTLSYKSSLSSFCCKMFLSVSNFYLFPLKFDGKKNEPVGGKLDSLQ